ncbi:MAG TPA: GGDEF domain-containing protein [Dissulfurispiraceae bacterium]|nr:GGDEF domain-containing protein [Dissulfurispiraceae bacterium]
MGLKTIIDDLSKYLKRMVFVNMLFFCLIIPVVLLYLGVETSSVAAITALGGMALCVANFYFISGFFVRKTETSLTMSYASIQNEYLYDDLTKVYNRRSGLVRLNEEFARAKRSGAKLSVAMVDADHFKNINDTYGHLVGDKVLTHIASTIKAELRECDIVIRYGGEEFLILLPDTHGTNASLPLDRLRRKLVDNRLSHDGMEIHASVSIGIATVSALDQDPMDAIRRADSALYSAKRLGRNRVFYDRRRRHLAPVLSNA